ncbi:MAG: hypothetical protein WAL66_15255 [Nitrososphaeraceae archaeon]
MVSNSLIINNVLKQGTIIIPVITQIGQTGCYKLEDPLRGVARPAIRFQCNTYLNDKEVNVTHESK